MGMDAKLKGGQALAQSAGDASGIVEHLQRRPRRPQRSRRPINSCSRRSILASRNRPILHDNDVKQVVEMVSSVVNHRQRRVHY